MRALCFLAALVACNAQADANLYLGAWSKHITGTKDRNEQHDLIAVDHRSWVVGRFINSHDRETFFVARKWQWSYKGLKAGVLGGAMHGYTVCWREDGSSKDVCPLLAPYFTYDAGAVSPIVFLFGEAIAVSVRIEL